MTIKEKDLLEIIKNKQYSKDVINELSKYEVKALQSVYDLKEGDTCWRVDILYDEFEYFEDIWHETSNAYRALGMIHLTEEKAKLHTRVLNTELAIKEWKYIYDNIQFNWHDSQFKYCLMYDNNEEEIAFSSSCDSKSANTIYFSSRDKAQQCIDDLGQERIIEWLTWQDNGQ